jgi:phthalate 3,4-dioxygenase beta subunit
VSAQIVTADAAEPAVATRRRKPVGMTDHFEISRFLEDEAALLDDRHYLDWLALMEADLDYRMPVRVSRSVGDGEGFEGDMNHFRENLATLTTKARRLLSVWAWSDNPASRTRRIISSIRPYETDAPGEFEVSSSIVVLRYREAMEIVTARREDVVRRRPDGWGIARRLILCDQTTLLTQNLAIFL